MTFRDQDSRSRLEVQVRGETETKLSKMCLKTRDGLENSITSNYSRPLMYFPTRNLDAQNLTSTVWEAIAALQSCGMTVICLIADGLSTNRKMFELMRYLDNCSHQCVNIYNPETRYF